MPDRDIFLLYVERFEGAGIPYMVTGSVAAMTYGVPRLTHDVDLVVELSAVHAQDRIVKEFPLEEFYCPPIEVVRVEAARERRGHFNLIHHRTGFKADVYLMGKDPFQQWAFDRRQRLEIAGASVWFAPPEYVIVKKLEYYSEGGSEKHVSDIRGMLKVSAGKVDLDVVARFAAERGLSREWESIHST